MRLEKLEARSPVKARGAIHQADASAPPRTPSAPTIARLTTISRDRLSKAETVTVAAIEAGAPLLVEARVADALAHDAKAEVGGKRHSARSSNPASGAKNRNTASTNT